jgi:EAL domain-containing protein (putative c-di-GMP-specific phosphodiesterase class I)
VLELTESLLVEDSDGLRRSLLELRGEGYRIAIDDFGTGYSALAHLHRFPVDLLKIDRSFVVAMRSSPVASTVVRAAVQLAHALGLDVVAEGVETADELGRMAAQGCDYAQGYWLARPLPAAAATLVLREGNGRVRAPA